ncbi:hypothetical protein HMPREF1557_01749 [Streptococcus sobrinus W1703]|uniref:Uncharacterized protein n=1 Tax=Streptococcus sobrinus W1703 TaxID=1227275 RepID=U2KHL9_9STRE|nr:hypothetical protein HMPREF1557_01749 [Streptococcus sobrinus W1703]
MCQTKNYLTQTSSREFPESIDPRIGQSEDQTEKFSQSISPRISQPKDQVEDFFKPC